MAIFIIDNKKYDTEKMEVVAHVKQWQENELLCQFLGKGYGHYCDYELYRSEKGNYLLVRKAFGQLCGEAIAEDAAKELLLCYDYKAYEKIYGEIEEA